MTFGAKLESFEYDAGFGTLGHPAHAQVGRVHHAHQGARVARTGEPTRFLPRTNRRRTDHEPLDRRVCLRVRLRARRSPLSGRFDEDATPVEPADLAKRSDLVGKKVALDDHVAYYRQTARKRSGRAAIEANERDVPGAAKVAPAIRKPPAALVQGVLRREGGRLVCDVTELKPVAGDLERLENGVKGLGRERFGDAQGVGTLGRAPARDFKNDALMKRARELEAEAFRIETAMKRLGVDAPQEWLAMAKDARSRRVPGARARGACASRPSAPQLAAATDRGRLRSRHPRNRGFLPEGRDRSATRRAPTSRGWEELLREGPGGGLPRSARKRCGKAFDRRLWADANERLIEAQKPGDLQAALSLAERAATLLPEKKELSARLIEKAVGQARENLGSLQPVRAERAGRRAAEQAEPPGRGAGRDPRMARDPEKPLERHRRRRPA